MLEAPVKRCKGKAMTTSSHNEDRFLSILICNREIIRKLNCGDSTPPPSPRPAIQTLVWFVALFCTMSQHVLMMSRAPAAAYCYDVTARIDHITLTCCHGTQSAMTSSIASYM